MTIKLSKNLDVSEKMEWWFLQHLINLTWFYFKMTLLPTNTSSLDSKPSTVHVHSVAVFGRNVLVTWADLAVIPLFFFSVLMWKVNPKLYYNCLNVMYCNNIKANVIQGQQTCHHGLLSHFGWCGHLVTQTALDHFQ